MDYFYLLFFNTILHTLSKTTIGKSLDYNSNTKYNHGYKNILTSSSNIHESMAHFWQSQASSTIIDRVNQKLNKNIAKNTILFLGDGMSIATITAARIFLGQRLNTTGEETQLSFEKFQFSGLAKTYCVDGQVPDSACTATAFFGGIKSNIATIGVTAAVLYKDCEAMLNKSNHVDSIAHLSQLSGKRTGIVTTTRITHASPAGAFAHTANRDWESDINIVADKKNPKQCLDIATQLIHGNTGQNFNVIFGGGRRNFLPKNQTDEEGIPGNRLDGRNLIKEWQSKKNGTRHQYVHNLTGLKSITNDKEFVLGLFDSNHIAYNLDRNTKLQPSLEEMTIKAIDLLSQEDKGFFLFVEGGRIDHSHHENFARKALDETIEFHKAIQAAVKMTDESDTLIVVTSDHSHTMTFNGYPVRGNDILGIAGYDEYRLPYMTLSYANGPGEKVDENGNRLNLSNHNFSDPNYRYPSYVFLDYETHAGEDVAVYANGPWAHLLSGVSEQNVIPLVLKFASCVGEDGAACAINNSSSRSCNTSGFIMCICIILIFVKISMQHEMSVNVS